MKMWVALLSTAVFTTAVADQRPLDKERSLIGAEAKFDALDRNDDERLSQSEARVDDDLAAVFVAADKDSDGYVSKFEYTGRANTRRSGSS